MAEETAEAKCQCSRTWVLVVHNDFLQIEGYERHGNDVDLENLRRVFQIERRCRFAELKKCDKEQILGTLSSEQKLIKIFFPDGDYDEKISTPEILYLFVLSHGESGGRILTDHFINKPSMPSHFMLELETYNTSDIWNNLADLNFLKTCTKIIFLAPCRGINPEIKMDPVDKFTNIEGEKIILPGWLTSNPNREDFIIFYATVENTSANRNELRGTWFVQSICSVLDNMKQDLDILIFFTRVQFQVCQMTKIGHADVGQTPQLHFFSKNEFDVCARHYEIKHRIANIQLINKNEDLSDYRRMRYYNDDLVAEKIDAKGFNLQNVLEDERALFYNWGQQNFHFSRGRALIFHDDQHLNHPLELAACFMELNYKVKLDLVKNIKSFKALNSVKRKFVSKGSLVVCILAQLVETDAGLALLNEGDFVLLSAIVDAFSGTECKHLIGKPKLFFFLDEGNKQDTTDFPQFHLNDAHQFTNSNAGVNAFVGVGAALIEGLCLILNSEELQNGSKSLQVALVELIRSTESMPLDRMSIIKPQIISTLPVLVDFPKLKLNKKKIIALSGSTFLVLLLTFVLASVFWSHSSFKYKKDNKNMVGLIDMLDVELQKNCSINFLPKNTSTVEAFSMELKDWFFIVENCKEHWEVFKSESYVATLIVDGKVAQAVSEFNNSSIEERSAAQQLKLVVLFACDEIYQSNLGRFCFELHKLFMGEQCFDDAFKRMTKFCGTEDVTVLNFWYYYLKRESLPFSVLKFHNKTDFDHFYWADYSFSALEFHTSQKVNCWEGDQHNNNLPIDSSDFIQKIFALISYEIRVRKKRILYFKHFLQLDEEVKKFYLPILASYYYDKGFNLRNLIDTMKFNVGYLACCAFNELFERLKNDGKLQSNESLYLREASHEVLQEGNAVVSVNGDGRRDEILVCANVSQELADAQLN